MLVTPGSFHGDKGLKLAMILFGLLALLKYIPVV